ncbi:MAG: N,N-dimethylformamidase beta subunit family domain-containing protein [Mucilaginibacter sp.]
MKFLKYINWFKHLVIGFIFMHVCIGCMKSPRTVTSSNVPPPVDSLGDYSITEVGDSLLNNPNFSKTLNGYTDKTSYYPGDMLSLYLSCPVTIKNSVITLYNTKGNSILSVSATITTQKIKSQKPWVDGFGYAPTFSIKLPANLKSGIYTWTGKIPFVVKGNGSSYDLTVVYPSNTLNAYNPTGGKSLYAPNFNNRATVLSFHRSDTIDYANFYKWIDNQSYNINYIADSDLDDYSQIQNSKVVIVTGHSEYWTLAARENIDKFVASGKNVLMLAGDNMWWQVRYNKSKDLMICYKDIDGSANEGNTLDPLGGTLYSTVNWGTPIVKYPIISSIGADYRGGGYGNTLPNRWNGFRIVQENSPLFQGTGLKNGDILSMPTREYDSAPIVKLFPQVPSAKETPVIDTAKLHFYKTELVGYDFAQNLMRRDRLGFGTFIVCKKSPTSGTIVNTATMDWCATTGIVGIDKFKVQKITKNMIDLSLANASLFSN